MAHDGSLVKKTLILPHITESPYLHKNIYIVCIFSQVLDILS